MASRIPVACPKCRTILNIREEYFGRVLECVKCEHAFAPSLADALGSAPSGESATVPDPVERVKVECPGCHQWVKIRSHYMGRTVACCLCQNLFVAKPGPVAESEPIATDANTKLDRLMGAVAGCESTLGTLAGRVEGLEVRFDSLNPLAPDSEVVVDPAVAERDQLRQTLLDLEASFSRLREEIGASRDQAALDHESARQSFQDEIEAKFAAEREQARQRIEQQRDEIEALRRQHAEVESGGLEVASRIAAFESRIGSLDEIPSSHAQLKTENQAFNRLAADHFEKIFQELRQLGQDRSERQARQEVIETERAANQEELGRLRLEIETVKRDALTRPDPDSSEIAKLRPELSIRKSNPEPVAELASSSSLGPVEPASIAPGVGFDLTKVLSSIDVDELAHDLIKIGGETGRKSGFRGSESSILSTPHEFEGRAISSSEPKAGASEITTEFDQLRGHFARLMSQRELAEATSIGRRLVELACEQYGIRSMKHALWLRNLGVCLIMNENLPEARDVLLHAWQLSLADLRTNPMPHVICLIDLGDLHQAEGDDEQAKACYEQAFSFLNKMSLPADNPLILRAQGGLNQVLAKTSSLAGLLTTSITT